LNIKEYTARSKRVRDRDNTIEELILDELKGGAVQAWPILETVQRIIGDVPERMVLRKIYNIMGIDPKLIPETAEEDYFLL
jgi:hypothetical protein